MAIAFHFFIICVILVMMMMRRIEIVESSSLISLVRENEDDYRGDSTSDEKETSRIQKMVSIRDFKNYTEQNVEPLRRQYWNDGADNQLTLRENIEAFTRLRIRPKLLRGSARVDTTTTVLGRVIEFPVGLSPSAFHKWAHSDGEVGSARAASSSGTVMILSSYTNHPMEEVVNAAPNASFWAQTYIFKDRSITTGIVRRAEELGFDAIVATIDSPVLGNKLNDKRSHLDIPSTLRLPNYEESYRRALQSGYNGSVMDYADSMLDSRVTWEDFSWLCTLTNLPVVAKGILTAEDAKEAVKNGAKAILVSNHGGRQLDNVPATIEALPEIVSAVGDDVEVFVDGGIRLGTDIFKALAFGARAVFVGRPVIWGLVYLGSKGVKRVLNIYREEFERTMFLAGAASVSEIETSMVVRHRFYDLPWMLNADKIKA